MQRKLVGAKYVSKTCTGLQVSAKIGTEAYQKRFVAMIAKKGGSIKYWTGVSSYAHANCKILF